MFYREILFCRGAYTEYLLRSVDLSKFWTLKGQIILGSNYYLTSVISVTQPCGKIKRAIQRELIIFSFRFSIMF